LGRCLSSPTPHAHASGMQRSDGTAKDGPPPAVSPGGAGKDDGPIATKREYNRWLVTQENYASAEAVRATRKAAEEMLQERERKHKAQGLSRQQAATAQMKKATEAVEEHRESNLTLGRKVSNEISEWRMGAKATKDSWSEYGKSIRDRVKAADATGESLKELGNKKKAQASNTRKEDEECAKKVEEFKEQRKKDLKENATKIKEATKDVVIDDAKRYFYEKRLASSKEVKDMSAKCEKDRSAEKANFQTAQNARRKKAKSAREQAGKSRTSLKSQRAEEASALRDIKRKLAEERAARAKADDEKKQAARQAVLRSIAFDPTEAREGLPSPSKSISPTGAAR
jgi:hypothetical protein